MTDTYFTSNLVMKGWALDLFHLAQTENYMSRFTGKDKNSIIMEKTELNKNKGDSLVVGLMADLNGAGIRGDSTLIGNEERLYNFTDTVTIDQIRNAVRLKGKMEEQRAAYNLRKEAKEGLKNWWVKFWQNCIFCHLAGDTTTNTMVADFPAVGIAPSADHIIYGGDATSDGTIAAGCHFTTQEIDRAVAKAKTYINSSTSAAPKSNIRPVLVKGKEYYVCIIHPYQLYTLRRDPAWLAAQQNAGPRTEDNPIFSGMEGVWNGVVIHSHDQIPLYTTWGGDGATQGARALFLGAQAAIVGKTGEPFWEEDTTSSSADFGNKPAFAVGCITGIKKTIFNSVDFGVIVMDTYAPTPSGSVHSTP